MGAESTSTSTSSSTMSSNELPAVHHASLVDRSTHSPALLKLIGLKVSRPIIEYVVGRVTETVEHAMGFDLLQARGRTTTRDLRHSKFAALVANLLSQTEVVTMPVILASLVYIDRAKYHLRITQESKWHCERVFLGALIVASKYLNDTTHNNSYWARCTGIFGKRDIGRIEREFLDVLDWELIITQDDLLDHHAGISAVTSPTSTRLRRVRRQHRNGDTSRPDDHSFSQSQSQSPNYYHLYPIPLPTLYSEYILPQSEELDTANAFLFLPELDSSEVPGLILSSPSPSSSSSSSPSASPSPRTPSPMLSYFSSITFTSQSAPKPSVYHDPGLREFSFDSEGLS